MGSSCDQGRDGMQFRLNLAVGIVEMKVFKVKSWEWSSASSPMWLSGPPPVSSISPRRRAGRRRVDDGWITAG
jgi:hypothetical protein